MAGIYIHIPFCRSKCVYCDFYSIARHEWIDEYVTAIIAEYAERIDELGGQPVNTIYLGGGTPSILPPSAIAQILRAMATTETSEITIEVNPEDVTAQRVLEWRSAGVNRISMGVQSLYDVELKAINRRHSASQALRAVDVIKENGIANISLDLIYGLPLQSVDSFVESVLGCINAGATHLSAYLLSYEPGTLLTRRLEMGALEETSEEVVEEMYDKLCQITSKYGFEHYEISNFACSGYRSRHNSSYWDLTPYLGLGTAAHSLGADGTRRFHLPDLKSYLREPNRIEVESENEEERLDDLIVISLRRVEGLNLNDFPPERRQHLLDVAASHIDAGRLILAGERLYVPEKNWLKTDAIARDLLFV